MKRDDHTKSAHETPNERQQQQIGPNSKQASVHNDGMYLAPCVCELICWETMLCYVEYKIPVIAINPRVECFIIRENMKMLISSNQIWLTMINIDNLKWVTIIFAPQLSALAMQHSSGEMRKERPSPSGFQLFVTCHFPFLSSDFLSIFYCLLMQGSNNTS